jgi:hypothetical protein
MTGLTTETFPEVPMADSNDTRTLTLPEMQALAARLHARGVSALSSDSKQSQSDMRLAAGVIRGLLASRIQVAETAGQMALQLSGPVTVGGEG